MTFSFSRAATNSHPRFTFVGTQKDIRDVLENA